MMLSAAKRRRVYSIQSELIRKSKQAALNAVQTFNNPLTSFKSETFVVLMIISWMYLLHAFYKKQGLEYHYHTTVGSRKKYDHTKGGSKKAWELERCLNEETCPVDGPTKANLRFLIGLRHEIEHQLCLDLDDAMVGRYLACCLNYERTLTDLFGAEQSLDEALSLTLQFRNVMAPNPEAGPALLPANVTQYIPSFDSDLAEEDFGSPHFALRFIFIRRTVNHPGQADRIIEFFDADSEMAKAIEREYWAIKEVEKDKKREKDVLAAMQTSGFPRFNTHHHRQLWKALDAKNPSKGFAIELGGQWFWYNNWIQRVRQECEAHPEKYGPLKA